MHNAKAQMMIILPLMLLVPGACSLPERQIQSRQSEHECKALLSQVLESERQKRTILEQQFTANEVERYKTLDSENTITAQMNELVKLREENRTLRDQLSQLKDIEKTINEHEPSAILPLNERQTQDDVDE